MRVPPLFVLVCLTLLISGGSPVLCHAGAKVDYYALMGVSKNATPDELKKAYRKLAMQYHPDRNPGDKAAEQKFKDINEAYDVLKDEQKRAAYDRYGFSAFDGSSPRSRYDAGAQAGAGTRRPGSGTESGFDFGSWGKGARGPDESDRRAEDLMGMFRRTQGQGVPKGEKDWGSWGKEEELKPGECERMIYGVFDDLLNPAVKPKK